MCGIAGIRAPLAKEQLVRGVIRMTDALVHRGPDGSGVWSDEAAGLVLGHRRLAIVDLSAHGFQPMASASGRFVITYNGELYNTDELRAPLLEAGVVFRGTSDTEVLVNAIEHWGIDRTLRAINGIFAFAVWDRAKRSLTLVRDRIGVKPLFWSFARGTLLFASELKALAAYPGFDCSIDLKAVGSYLQYNYIRSPMTIYAAARALEPGTMMTLPESGEPRIERYWELSAVVRGQTADRRRAVDVKAEVDELESLLADAVRRQLVSDVPIGAFLSGGVDSSTVVALMQKVASRPVRSFSIGFDIPAYNEAENARSVARALGTEHSELYVTERDALDCVPELSKVYDQPHADPSSIPTYLLCKLARSQVTVALSGDGGDELFCGYRRFAKAARTHAWLAQTPAWARTSTKRILQYLAGPPAQAREQSDKVHRMLWHGLSVLEFAADDVVDSYLHHITHWKSPSEIVPGASADLDGWRASTKVSSDFNEIMMYYETMTYLADGVLAKVDRASMCSSLEARVPLLDHRIVEQAWRLPHELKYRDGVSKWCLRQVLYRHVPRELVDRPKGAFGAPIGQWIRGPLRDWAESRLGERALREQGLINPEPVQRVWKAHLAGNVNASSNLWSIILLQDWLAQGRAKSTEYAAA